MTKRYSIIPLLLILAACQSSQHEVSSDNSDFHSCFNTASNFRQRVLRESADNAGFPAMTEAPFLHGTRFYDLLAHDVENDLEAQELLSAMARLGDAIRRSENNTLRNPADTAQLNAISRCSFAFANGVGQEALRQTLVTHIKNSSVIEDHYNSSAQWLGLLGVLRPFLEWRIDILHEEEQVLFDAEEQFSRSNAYQLGNNTTTSNIQSVRELFANAYSSSPLDIPQFSDQDLLQLFKQHAPRLHIEAIGAQDLIGTPGFTNQFASVNTAQATAYYLPSYTRFNNQNLIQLNYVFWFPSREPRTWIDLYSGAIDSLVWRVTFDQEGNVLLYDSIHSCGCYHKYYLASELLGQKAIPLSAEPANVFDLAELNHSEGLRLVVTSNEHFIVGVDNQSVADAKSYSMAPYSALYNIETTSGVRSFFDSKGIIPGSERLERYTLWPTGIDNVGAMRQWGTHATGFIARQHFDDAALFDKYFQYDD